ncbi:MAG TPA: hypothetical protein VN673_18250, partial [Clostridia bacterium]|nr:hypothetical protein [Clostridia bacterium]
MSDAGLEEFSSARKAQLQKNEARRMRTHVQEARGNIQRSASRWPFELTQNAHDPGPRAGQTHVNISVSFDGTNLIYEHDGKPFSAQELAALLSGGSSKEFEATDTTGRFGTGFLLTHVLSLQVHFQGIFATAAGHESVRLALDRSGDEDTIYANTLACEEGIKKGVPLSELNSHQTAHFSYKTDDPEAALLGLVALEKTLLYLYGTCEHLGTATLRHNGRTVRFQPESPVGRGSGSFHFHERQVAITENGIHLTTAKVVRLRKQAESLASLVAVLEKSGQTWRFLEPPLGAPRLYCRFPLRLSDFLPINAVIDGRFDVPQERDAILMEDRDKEQIAEALSLLPTLVQIGLQDSWVGTHKLAFVGMPDKAFGEDLEPSLKIWWREQLSATARKLGEMPIVLTTDGQFHQPLSPDSSPAPTCFVLPRFDANQTKDELDFAATWTVASELRSVTLPALAIAEEWTAIAAQWLTLSVPVRRLTLLNIAGRARKGATTFAELQTT